MFPLWKIDKQVRPEMLQCHHVPLHKDILMPNNSLTNPVRLIFNSAILQYDTPRNDRALELERHLRCREERISRPDIMQQTRKVVRLGVVRPLREVRLDECGAVDIDAVAVVECLLVQMCLFRP